MALNDPTDNGGLFLGRRPGTAPLRYRSRPVTAGAGRRGADRALAAAILAVETLVLATVWGPQPVAWLWAGSKVGDVTGSNDIGIFAGLAGLAFTLVATLVIAKWLDDAWKLVRRAAGHEQRGALERVMIASLLIVVACVTVLLLAGGSLPSLQGG